MAGNGTWVEPEHRRIGMVFQDGALFPHLTVERNVAFGASRRERVAECLELVGLSARADSYPHELSGGERQRVALARALAADPEVVLLDEPFASLDAGLRDALRAEVAGDPARAPGTSALLVTHDQAEALSLAGTVAVMRDGRVEQVGTPEEIYERPLTRWVAEFLGEADVLPGTASRGVVECELGRFGAAPDLAGRVERRHPPRVGGHRHRPGERPGRGPGGGRGALVLRPRPARAPRAAERPAAALAAGSASPRGIPATASGSGSTARSARVSPTGLTAR